MEVARAFRILNSSRGGNGFGLNPIALGDIREYIGLFGDPWIGVESFIQLLTDMDMVFRELVLEKTEEKQNRESKVIDKRGTE